MKKFTIEDSFFEIMPDAKIGVITVIGLDNQIHEENKYQHLLSTSQQAAHQYLGEDVFSENQVIKVWREAFSKFKTKKGARSSIEALLKRVSADKELNPINPLVDLYNSISLKYALPCGGEDIDTFQGDVKLTLADGTEEFITLGSNKSEPPYPGEIVYKDELGAICRCFNWRESVRTMLTENTTNAFLCIELVDLSREEEFKAALNELQQLIADNLGGESCIHILDTKSREILIEN